MNGSSCNQPQATVDRAPFFDGKFKKKAKMPGAALSRKGFHRPDMRMRRKVKFL